MPRARVAGVVLSAMFSAVAVSTVAWLATSGRDVRGRDGGTNRHPGLEGCLRGAVGRPTSPSRSTAADVQGREARSLAAAVREARYSVHRADGRPAHGEVAAGEVLSAGHPAQGYATRFHPDGARVTAKGGARWSLGMRLAAFGVEGDARPVAEAERRANGRRVEYVRDGIVEWYENADAGLEHGFTVERAPVGSERIEIALACETPLAPRVTADGRSVGFESSPGVRVLSYSKLAAFDATGRSLDARMASREGGIAILVDARGAEFPVTVDPVLVNETKILASDGEAEDVFGCSVSMSGDTAVVGAYGDSDSAQYQGSAYVFVRTAAGWVQQQRLVASDAEYGDNFGNSVSVSGDTVLVGAPLDDGEGYSEGSAYVFVRSGDMWTQAAKLTASDGTEYDFFGTSVSLDGDTAVIGAPCAAGSRTFDGCAYVFTRAGTSWLQTAKLAVPDGEDDGEFGCSVSVSNDTALVGWRYGPGRLPGSGCAVVFVRSGATWTETARLAASDGEEEDEFAASVSLSGDTAVVGAPMDTVGLDDSQGSAYVFVRSGTAWTQQQKLVVPEGSADDGFGWSVAVKDDTAVVGARSAGNGAAYVFARSGSAWTRTASLVPSDGSPGQEFGCSVALDGDTVLVGSYQDDDNGNASGSAYFFDLSRKVLASDGVVGDQFGYSVAIEDDTALIGAPYGDGADFDSGCAYVFARSGAVWTEQQKLAAQDGLAGDEFGTSVSLSGDTAVVGAPMDTVGQGSAYVFVRSGTTWTQQKKLTASDGAASDYFGTSVSVSGDTAVVGAPYDTIGANIYQGSAYVFVRSGTTWTQKQKLTASGGADSDFFGTSVSVSGDTAVVGALGADIAQGAAYVFVRSGTTWTQKQKLWDAGGQNGDCFGCSVSVVGDTAVVGAPSADIGANDSQGAAYVFVRSGTTWTQQKKLTASDGAASDYFGTSVSVSGDGGTIVVGAHNDDEGAVQGRGSAYVFVRVGDDWAEARKLVALDGAENDRFGCSVAVSGKTALVGAAWDDDLGADSGSAYFFELDFPLPRVEICAFDPIAIEGTRAAQFRICRMGGFFKMPLTVSYTISGTATNAVDYNYSAGLSGSATIPADEDGVTIAIDPYPDGEAEGAETVVLTLSPGESYVLGERSSDTAIISDDTTPVVNVVATDPDASEGYPYDVGTFTFFRTPPGANQVSVGFTILGTATQGQDYVALTNAILIPSGVDSVTLTVVPVDDAAVEGNETVVLTIGSVDGGAYSIGPLSTATVTITSDDASSGGGGGCAPSGGASGAAAACLALAAACAALGRARRRSSIAGVRAR